MLADKLRKAVLQAAIQGKLTEQLPTDGNAADLVAEIKKEKERLIKEKKLKKQKSLPEITAEEIPFEIPDNWCWVRLGDISYTNIGLTFKPTDISSEGTIVLRSSNIQNGKINLDDIVRINIDISESKKCYRNDLLICVRNGSKNLVGKTAIINNDGFTFGAFMAICRSKCYRYLYYYLSSPLFRGDLDNVSTTTINQITQTNLKNRLIPLPPLKEQQRITEILKNILVQIEKLKVNEEKLDLLQKNFPDRLKKSLLQAAIQGKLTQQLSTDDNVDDLLAEIREEKEKLIKEKKIKKQKPLPPITAEEIPFEIPANWRWVRLGELCNIVNGFTPLKSNILFWNSKDILWFTAKDLKGTNRRIKSTKQYISMKAIENKKSRILPPKTVLICCTASIGECAITEIELTTNQQFNGLIINKYWKKYFNEEYLFIFVQTLKKQLLEIAGKTTINFISVNKLSNIVVPLPPISEQKHIVKQLNQLLDNVERL